MFAKKIWCMARVVLLALQNGIANRKTTNDHVRFKIKHGKILRKTLENLMVQYHTRLSCQPDDVLNSFVSPREYEFSCSSSPPYRSYTRVNITKTKHKHLKHKHKPLLHKPSRFDGDGGIRTIRMVISTPEDDDSEGADTPPLVASARGKVRQVRITDSPFLSKDGDDDDHVDKAAEEFIDKFYRDLRLQKWLASRY